MGCTQSKIENEEPVMRCKDRKQFMKEAVAARNAFAAAHSAYAMSLKNTGAALSDFAHGEVENSQLVNSASHQSSVSAAAAAAHPLPPPPPHPSMTSLTPPPPPIMAPIQRAFSMPEMKLQKTREQGNGAGPTIVEENDGDDEEEEIESNEKLIVRKSKSGRNKSGDPQTAAPAVEQERVSPPVVENSGSVQAVQDWDYWFPPMDNMPGPSLEVKEEENENVESKVFDDIPRKIEHAEEKPKEVPPPSPVMVEDVGEMEKVVAEAASGGGIVRRTVKRGKSATEVGEKRAVKGSTNLLEVFEKLDDHFLKASESAYDVSKMLEATRLHYHTNFADNRGNFLV